MLSIFINIILLPVFSLIVICAYPIIFLYAQNVGEVFFIETLFPLLIFITVGLIIEGIIYLCTKSIIKSALIADIFILLLINYTLLESGIKNIIPSFKYWHIAPLLIVICLHISFILYRRLSDNTSTIILKAISLMMAGLIGFNLIIAAPIILKKINLGKEENIQNETIIINSIDLPNIYYILLDEYSGFNTIKKYYGYDNLEFAKYLEDKKFTVSMGGYNDSFDTFTVTTNNLNVDYVVTSEMILAERMEYRKDPKLFTLLDQYGYEINNMSDTVEWQGVKGSIKENTKAVYGDFLKMLLEKTIIYPFLGISDEIVYRTNTINAFKQLHKTFESSETPIFTYAHIECPHTPFVFDQNGDMPDFASLNDWKDKRNYLGQFNYVTKQVKDVIETITMNDPNSIIILQSDHSARWTQNDQGEQIVTNEDKRNFLNATYYKGESIDEIDGQSAVNTLRIIVSKVLGIDMPVVEVIAE